MAKAHVPTEIVRTITSNLSVHFNIKKNIKTSYNFVVSVKFIICSLENNWGSIQVNN